MDEDYTEIPDCECGHSPLDHGISVVDGLHLRFDGPCKMCPCEMPRILVNAPRENAVVYGIKG
jgi:hypothetical protein